jgi:hypothetical protein
MLPSLDVKTEIPINSRSSAVNIATEAAMHTCSQRLALIVVFLGGAAQPLMAQQVVLETTQVPSDPPTGNWPSDTCGGRIFLYPGGASYEWTPVIKGFGQRGSVEGVSGAVLNAHPSTADVPFTHPFDKVDWDYLVLPDAPALPLLAPNNDELDDDRAKAITDANDLNLPLHVSADGKHLDHGVLAVEQERGLIPDDYRPRSGDRVAVFGRWIVDCGHDNWQSEIHPPVLTATARRSAPAGRTHVDLIANPYLVDQEFAHGGLRAQLLYELALVENPIAFIPFTDQVTAQASFMPSTSGTTVFSFKVRPPTPAPSDKHRLYVRMHLTARPGVVIQPVLVDENTVAFVGIFTDQLTMEPITGTTQWNVTGDDLKGLDPHLGDAWNAMVSHVGGPGQSDPVKGWVLSRGIKGILYDSPVPPDLTNAPVTEGWAINNPWGQNPVHYQVQPFPLIGWIELDWRIPTGVIGSFVDRGAWTAIERHLNEMHLGGSDNAERLANWIPHIASVAPMPPRGTADVTGQWDYRAIVERNVGERGKLFLRSNGAYVQGVLDLGTNHRESVTGTITPDGKTLILNRTTAAGAQTVIRLTQRGSGYVGAAEGGRGSIELVRR